MTEANDRAKTKENKTDEPKKDRYQEKQKKPRIRLIPVWLRVILILLLLLLSLVVGAIVGYGVIGEGEPFDILKKDTWQHIIDIVVKE